MKGILIAIFGGLFGGYRFYKKQTLMGVLYLCTAGLYFVGWIIDMSSAYREYFESKIPTSELSTKTSGAKTKGIIAAILSFTILCGGLGVAGVFLPETESSSSSSSSGESYGQPLRFYLAWSLLLSRQARLGAKRHKFFRNA